MTETDPEKIFQETVEIVNRRKKYFRRTKTAANIVAQVMTKRSIAGQQTDEQINDQWRNIVGDKIAKQSRPGMIRRGILEIIVNSSAVLQKLQFQKKKILDQLQVEEKQNH